MEDQLRTLCVVCFHRPRRGPSSYRQWFNDLPASVLANKSDQRIEVGARAQLSQARLLDQRAEKGLDLAARLGPPERRTLDIPSQRNLGNQPAVREPGKTIDKV